MYKRREKKLGKESQVLLETYIASDEWCCLKSVKMPFDQSLQKDTELGSGPIVSGLPWTLTEKQID